MIAELRAAAGTIDLWQEAAAALEETRQRQEQQIAELQGRLDSEQSQGDVKAARALARVAELETELVRRVFDVGRIPTRCLLSYLWLCRNRARLCGQNCHRIWST